MGITNAVFIILFLGAVILFWRNAGKIARNIRLGKPADRSDRMGARWNLMFLVAMGQKKMFSRPLPALLHFFVYAGFILINVEVVEMIVDGATGSHRFLSVLGGMYPFMLSFFEILAGLVTLGCILFLVRRNLGRIHRFTMKELDGWPRTDANLILCTEIVLMTAYYFMNAADRSLYLMGNPHYSVDTGNLPLSGLLAPLLSGFSEQSLIIVERSGWWIHMVGILFFLNYIVISKHLHIVISFPNVFYSSLHPKGKFTNPVNVTNEVRAILDPSFTPPPADPQAAGRFGAKDVMDLSWKQLMDAYSCTECGRCTSACPANLTGKMLSPRKIMMSTRDRLEEVGKNVDKNGKFTDDGKSLLHDYITPEELWACTSCNACTQECPVTIDPLGIIVEMRRFLVMEQSAAPQELNMMFTNIENNGAPWQFAQADRGNWKNTE
ncbi:MAG: (Fe-S)-binding protein [Bacteroidia bacterium]|nr:(Fe-S)-binding protein [Bacteroidia bacterium]